MIEKSPQADRILGARLMGSAKRLGRRELPAAEYAAAVAELRELAAGRADLLAETAGLLEGFGEGEPTGPMHRLAVRLCRDAGADPAAIPGWIEEGRRRREEARRPPFSGGVRAPLGRAWQRRRLTHPDACRRAGEGPPRCIPVSAHLAPPQARSRCGRRPASL
jgi:hypothetical protein